MSQARDLSVDLARGLACLLMIQTHAFHGWVRPELHSHPGFVATRWLGAAPLPAFLLLSGVAIALRVRASQRSAHAAGRVRVELSRRGLVVVLIGYLTSFAWGWMDGADRVSTFLRADVLHVIGISLLIGALLIGRTSQGGLDAPVDTRRLGRRSLVWMLLVSVLCPWLTRVTQDANGPWRFPLALFSEVRGVSVMPAVPLSAWCALGVVVGLWCTEASVPRIAPRRMQAIGVLGVVAMVVGGFATQWLVLRTGHALSRSEVTIWPNLLEGAGRGMVILAMGAWLAVTLPPPWQHRLSRLGAASLWVYVVHVPFCYGQLSTPLRAKLSLVNAVPWVLTLILASYGVVIALASMKARNNGTAVLRRSA